MLGKFGSYVPFLFFVTTSVHSSTCSIIMWWNCDRYLNKETFEMDNSRLSLENKEIYLLCLNSEVTSISPPVCQT